MDLKIIIGSIRQGRVAKPVGDWVYRVASRRREFATELIDSVQGARAVEQLRLVVNELQMAPIRDAVHIQKVMGKLGEHGFVGDDADERFLNKVLDELLWWGEAPKQARERSS